MKGLVVDFPRSPSPVIEWESEDELENNIVERNKSSSKGGNVADHTTTLVDLASTPPSPIIPRKRKPKGPNVNLPVSEKLSAEGRKRSPVLQRRRRAPGRQAVNILLPARSSTFCEDENVPSSLRDGHEGSEKVLGSQQRREESKVLIGSAWIAQIEEFSQNNVGNRVNGSESETRRRGARSGEIENLGESNMSVKERAGMQTPRIVGSSWIADISNLEEEAESKLRGESQSSASIGSWDGETTAQPFGEQTRNELAESFLDEQAMEGEYEVTRRSKKKALKGGLEEQLERALEWGRAGQALKRHQGAADDKQVSVQRLEHVGDCLVVHCVSQVESSGEEKLTLLINRLYCPTLPVPGQRISYGAPFTATKDRRGSKLIIGLTGLTLGEVLPMSAAEEEPAKKYVDLQCPCRDGGSCPSPQTSILPSPVPTLCLHTTCSQPTTLTPLYLAVENAVRGSGDGRVTLEVEVKLIWGCATALHVQQVELLVQDGEGQYSAVLRPIGSGQGWEGVLSGDLDKVVGAKIKVWGMLGVQDRHTRSNHPGLFRVLCGQGGDVQQQRIIYSLGISGGGLEILQQGKEPEITCPSLHQASGLAPGSRVNVGCNVLHLEKEEEAGTLYLQELAGGRSLLVPCDLSSMLVAQVHKHSGPFSCTLASALVTSSSSDESLKLSLDQYSCLLHCKPIALSDLILPPSSSPGDLVYVAGALEELDMAASTQWLECLDCGCEEVVEGRCKSCDSSQVEKRVHLVARIGKSWVELTQERALTLLPAISAAPAYDKDHLDTVEPTSILKIEVPPLLAMVGEGGRLRELKAMNYI